MDLIYLYHRRWCSAFSTCILSMADSDQHPSHNEWTLVPASQWLAPCMLNMIQDPDKHMLSCYMLSNHAIHRTDSEIQRIYKFNMHYSPKHIIIFFTRTWFATNQSLARFESSVASCPLLSLCLPTDLSFHCFDPGVQRIGNGWQQPRSGREVPAWQWWSTLPARSPRGGKWGLLE